MDLQNVRFLLFNLFSFFGLFKLKFVCYKSFKDSSVDTYKIYKNIYKVFIKFIIQRPSDFYFLDEYIMEMYDNGCECIKYNCGCCQHLQWDVVSMDGKCKYIIFVVYIVTII